MSLKRKKTAGFPGKQGLHDISNVFSLFWVPFSFGQVETITVTINSNTPCRIHWFFFFPSDEALGWDSWQKAATTHKEASWCRKSAGRGSAYDETMGNLGGGSLVLPHPNPSSVALGFRSEVIAIEVRGSQFMACALARSAGHSRALSTSCACGCLHIHRNSGDIWDLSLPESLPWPSTFIKSYAKGPL